MTSLISRRAAARLLNVRTSTLRAWAEAGVGPGVERGRYDALVIRAWVDETTFALSQTSATKGDAP